MRVPEIVDEFLFLEPHQAHRHLTNISLLSLTSACNRQRDFCLALQSPFSYNQTHLRISSFSYQLKARARRDSSESSSFSPRGVVTEHD